MNSHRYARSAKEIFVAMSKKLTVSKRSQEFFFLRLSAKFGCELDRSNRPCGYIPGNITGAIGLFLNIMGAIAPVAPVLNMPLYIYILIEELA